MILNEGLLCFTESEQLSETGDYLKGNLFGYLRDGLQGIIENGHGGRDAESPAG